MSSGEKIYFKFHLRLFWSVMAVFILLTASFVWFYISKEKQYKIEILNQRLSVYNKCVHHNLTNGLTFDAAVETDFGRTTILNLKGNVLYDSEKKDVSTIENHLNRKEIQECLQNGNGYDIRRHSETTGKYYFYAAKLFDDYIIRSAIPYNNSLINDLKIDYTVVWIFLLIVSVLSFIFFMVMKRLGQNINHLNDFAMRADKEGNIEYAPTFANNELGEISQHIIQIYNRLMKAKSDLVLEQKRVLKEQEQQALIKKQLTQNISHELKTPVSSIQGYLETILTNKDLSPDTIQHFVQKSYDQCNRLSSLLYDISNLTKLEEAPEMFVKETVDISEIIASTLSDVGLLLPGKNISVDNRTKGKTLICKGNPSLLYSIFRNLIDNTLAYAGTHIEIGIDCYKEDETHYFFRYYDTGIGVSEEHLPRLFERFYRVDKGRSRKSGGTGLGLAVVKNALLNHGGSINAKTHHPTGLEFEFSVEKK